VLLASPFNANRGLAPLRRLRWFLAEEMREPYGDVSYVQNPIMRT
jgi:hypothetical protein